MPPNNPLTPQIESQDNYQWTNRHQTVTQQVARLYDVWNANTEDTLGAYNATTAGIQSLIGAAIAQGKHLRALGGGWSLSPVAVTDGFLVNTKPMNMKFTLGASSVSPGYAGEREYLLFVQCGNSVGELDRYLQNQGESLKTGGSSNGQTIVGAVSTGTHGSAFDFGAVQEFVVGLHIICGPNRHVWLERASYPVVTPNFVQALGAELVRDDALFNAALVSFGSFGFIHGLMIETEPLFLLEAWLQWLPYDDALKAAIGTLDFSGLTLPHQPERPYHFEVIFNPNNPSPRAYVKTMYKRPYRTGYTPPDNTPTGRANGDDALAILGRLSTLVPFTRGLFNSTADTEYQQFGPQFGTFGEIFSNETVRGQVMSAAMAVPLASAQAALETAFGAYSDLGLVVPGLISLRYVKGTQATLGYTRFPQTCLLELDGISTHESLEFRDRVWAALETANIPFTMHWGKMNNLDAARVQRMYGNAVGQWLSARKQFLDDATRPVFSNQFLEGTGLNS